ncbi:hypothetical protein ACMFMG_006987 [Clarireedia jacksonii]
MIARIDHEHQERLKLEEQRQGLLKKKQGLIADNKKRKDDLANLDKDLEKFIDVSVLVTLLECLLTCHRLPNLYKRRLSVLCERPAVFSGIIVPDEPHSMANCKAASN